MVYVPAGVFRMGSDFGESDEKPIHNVYLDSFWIDQTEVTNEMFTSFINDSDYVTDAENTGSSYVYQSGAWKQVDGVDWNHPFGPGSDNQERMNHPVFHVSWNDAVAYCTWAGRRLPTEAEWEKAASWNDENQEKYVYPRGDSIGCASGNFLGCIGDTTQVGSYFSGKSPYGALDMAGNVWEWVFDWYGENYYQNSALSNPIGPSSGQYRVLRGGSWVFSVHFARSAFRGQGLPIKTYDYIGFRCALSATE